MNHSSAAASPITGSRIKPIVSRRRLALFSLACTVAALSLTNHSVSQQAANTRPYIMVDQFGYRPQDAKVAVLADPQQGFNAADQYVPGPQLEVRRSDDNKAVFSGKPVVWQNGETQANSGDRGWWFDFSSLKTPGSYYVFDAKTKMRSYAFEVRSDVYRKALKAAVRMFYYQRLNLEKTAQHAGADYTDAPAFVQDAQARSVLAQSDASLERDLSGGWMDAGDTNKYVTFANPVVHLLLTAYQNNPKAFTDDFTIPESGNGVPDLLDEVRYELEWLEKMQNPDGGVLLKIGGITFDAPTPLSTDQQARFYVPACSSSTIAAASNFAHAAIVYGKAGQTDFARRLRDRAVAAWDWYQNPANPKRDDCDDGTVKAGDADWTLGDQGFHTTTAAVYLFAATGNAKYNDYIKLNHPNTWPWRNNSLWGTYNPQEGDALLYYTRLANADPSVERAILERKLAGSYSSTYGQQDADLYRALMPDSAYHWGSNSVRANIGNVNMDMVYYGLDAGKVGAYQRRALGMLHSFHGVNPLNLTYLSNMKADGAENSVQEMYHTWFGGNSKWRKVSSSEPGPAPGYVVGGPNSGYGRDNPDALVPPKGEPAQKAYLDGSNALDWRKAIWELSEPALGYQATYVKLLSSFVP